MWRTHQPIGCRAPAVSAPGRCRAGKSTRRRWISTADCPGRAPRGCAVDDVQRRMQCRLLANLLHGAPDPVHVLRCRRLTNAPASRQADRRSVENPRNARKSGAARAGLRHELRQHRLAAPSQSPRNTSHTGAFGKRVVYWRQIGQRLIVQDDEPRDMQPLEPCERQQRVVRIDHARALRSSSPATRAGPPPASGRIGAATMKLDCGVMRERPPCRQNCSEKSISRVLSQYTLPRYSPGGWISRISSRIQWATIDVSE